MVSRLQSQAEDSFQLIVCYIVDLKVRLNDRESEQAAFSTGKIGKDNAIARHGIHGLYWLYSIPLPGDQFLQGNNSIYLTQARSESPFEGLMYDYIRLEAPPLT